MSPLEVSKLSLVDGQRRQVPPEIGQIAVRRGSFYVLVEVSAPTEQWDQASRQIVSRAISTFASSKLGESSALQSAAESVNEYLLDHNQGRPKKAHVWAGLNMLFVRDDHLYLAQAGPALTYIARGASITRFPKSFEELREEQEDALTPLGQREQVKCRLAHFTLQEGDILTMAASHLPTLGNDQAVAEAIGQQQLDRIAQALTGIARYDDFSALLVRYGESPAPKKDEVQDDEWSDAAWEEDEGWGDEAWEESVPVSKSPPPSSAKKKTPKATKAAPPPAKESEKEPAPRKQRSTRATPPPEAVAAPPPPRASAASRGRPKQAAESPPLAAGGEQVQSGPRQVGGFLLAGLVGLLNGLIRLLTWWRQRLLPRLHGIAPRLDQGALHFRHALHHLWRGTKRVLWQILPGDRPAPAPASRPVPPPIGDGSGFFQTAAILIPFLLLLTVALLGWSWRGTAGDTIERAGATSQGETSGLITQAQALIAQAQNVDEAQAQLLLQQAEALLTEAEAQGEPLEQVAALRAQAQQLMTRATHTVRPPTLQVASTISQSQPLSLLAQGEALYVVEQGGSALYRLFPDPEHPTVLAPPTAPLLSAQQRLGEGVLVGTPRFISWVPAGGGRAYGALLILTVEGQLFEFDPSSGLLKLLRFSPVVGDLRSASGYGGNLYLLDQGNKQIWKYVPDAAGEYSAPPQPWLTETGQRQISAPIDMAIDGFIYLLEAQGEVARFQVGERRPFALDPVTPPLSQPVALEKHPPENSDLFVADSQRVVRFDQNGRFLVEYRPPLGMEWGTVRDIALDPPREQLYVLSDKGVFLVDIRNTRRAPSP